MCFSSKAQDKSLQMAFSTSIISATGAQKCALSRKPAASCDQHGKRLTAATAGALADADVACAHDVGAVAELLGDTALGDGALGILLLAVELRPLQLILILVAHLRGATLVALLVLDLLLVVILRVDEAHNMHLMCQAHGWREHQHLVFLHPTHLLQHVHHGRGIRHGFRDLRVRQLDASELLLAGIAHHIARDLLEQLEGFQSLIQRQGPQGLLKRRQRVGDLVPRRIACVTHLEVERVEKRRGD
mmetsp:Transcript_1478/g.3742  ORF Transcript_1478/g.3742 Transcript_1478/m.3742 type:complete len:246 (+) Transcript_1478:363-1100(+)